MYKKTILILIILSLFFLTTSLASADELNENTTADFDELAVQINLTEPNHQLDLEKDYKFTNTSEKHIVIDKPITIDGKNHIIEAHDTSRAFWIKADNVTLKNINFINSKSADLAGGVISWWGNNGTLTNCNFTNNSASSAAGAVLWKGNCGIIEKCGFINNFVSYGVSTDLVSGEGYDKSMMIIQVVESEGGAVCIIANNVSVKECIFLNNTAQLNGGAISLKSSNNITVSSSRFKNNRASYNGGAIELNGENILISNSRFINNSQNDLFNNGHSTTLESSYFENKSSIVSWYNMTFNDVKFGDIGSFRQLAELINHTQEGGILILDKDYEYINMTNKGILIDKSITIDGGGHTLNGNGLSRMFNITSENVTLKNINFINGNAFGRYGGIAGGGAIYWSGQNGLIDNCNFTNNAGSGVEDDPYEKGEEIVDVNGTVVQIIHLIYVGAKINEGGAIVWNGTNGTVSNCIFIHNAVGYPNLGGAICWRGDNGSVINSEFYENNAWCGSAITWIGDNGKILSSTIANSSFFDGGIYWFGKNGQIRNSFLLGEGYRTALRPSDSNVDADYNFWGDTLENPNKQVKTNNVTKWLVIKFTHNGEPVKKGQKVIINYDITTLYNKNGKMLRYDGLINRSGQFEYTAEKSGFLNITFENGKINVNIDSKEKIVSKDKTVFYAGKISYKVKVYDVNGKVKSKTVKFTVNKKNYYVKTDKNGVATLKINLKPGKHTLTTSYGKAKVKNRITVKTTLITKNISKKVKKSAKFTVKVLNSKGKKYPNKTVKIKFKGKTYKIKTNKKGIASFKLPNNLKVGKYTLKTICNGLTNTNKITVKK